MWQARIKKIVKVTAFVFLILFVGLILCQNIPYTKQIIIVREMERTGVLAPFPKNAKLYGFKDVGGWIRSAYSIKFTADDGTIDKWLHDSKGIKGSIDFGRGNNSKYCLNGNNGWESVSVEVNRSSHTVKVSLSAN